MLPKMLTLPVSFHGGCIVSGFGDSLDGVLCHVSGMLGTIGCPDCQ